MAHTNTSETQINYDVQSQDERSESEISPEEKPEKEIKNEELDFVPNAHVEVNLDNLKTGNKFIDAWFDTTLYTPDRRPWEYDKIIVPIKSYIYIGFHARNTKRLPYNVSLTVANKLINPNELTGEERRYLINA